MKWLLLVFVFTAQPNGRLQLAETLEVEIESGVLCVEAEQIFRNENKRDLPKDVQPLLSYQTQCIKVRG